MARFHKFYFIQYNIFPTPRFFIGAKTHTKHRAFHFLEAMMTAYAAAIWTLCQVDTKQILDVNSQGREALSN